ncbi:hypothetical protein Tco_0564441 [Tanacetum coccineum]
MDVPEICMQEFWATAIVHHHSIRFKMNNKKHIVNLEDLGHSGEITVITDVNVNKLHQPWRSFAAVINKCQCGKSTGYDSLRLSQAQILWGMYHKKNVDYAYLLWEDFVYQVENKNVKRSNEMYYPRFTKVIVNFFMSKDQSIPKRNKVNWHFARDDYMFTTIKVVSRHEDTQLYGAILPNELTNEAIKDSESYKEYYAIASGAEPPKKKASVKKKQARSNKAPKAPQVALIEDEQMRIVTKRSLTQFHSSYASGSGANEGTSVKLGVLDVPEYGFNDEQISWKSSSDEDDDAQSKNDDDDDDADNQDNDNEQTDSDNDGDDFVHPKFYIHDEEDKEEDSFDPRVQTPSHYESTDDEESDEATHGGNVKGEELDEEETNEEDEANELYKDMNVNLDGRDIEMTDAPCTIIQTTQVIEDTYVIITSINPEGIDSIFNVKTESTSLVDVQTSYVVAANLSELELKKIFIDKIESNKSIHISDEQKNLYKALVDAYRNDEDKDEEPFVGSNRGSKRRRVGKEPESTSAPKEKTSKTTGKSTEGSKSHHKSAGESAQAEEPMYTAKDLEEPAHQEFEIGVTKDQTDEETSQLPDWFQKLAKPPTPDHDWNKILPDAHGPVQPWLSSLA